MTLFRGDILNSAFGSNVYIQFSHRVINRSDGLISQQLTVYYSLNKASEYHDVYKTQWRVL